MKKKKSKIIKLMVLGVLIIAGAGTYFALKPKPMPTAVSFTMITPQKLVNSIGIKGIVESVNKENVYSSLNTVVEKVNVSVGTKVKKGDILAVLDTNDLLLSIAQQKAELTASEKANLVQLQNSQRVYNESYKNLHNGESSQIASAEATVKTSKLQLETAQKNYEIGLSEQSTNTNSTLTQAQSTLASAELDFISKQTTHENSKNLFASGVISASEFKTAEDAYKNAANKLEDAKVALTTAKTGENKSIDQLESTLKAAQITYDNSLKARDAAIIGAKQEIEKNRSGVKSAQISISNDSKVIAVQKLEKQLADSTIKAPMDGTVTAVLAKQGALGNGLLFVVEDTSNLKITAKIKEYDAAKAKAGMDVVIKSEATGEKEYQGKLTTIDPTAVKTATGDVNKTTDVEFGMEISVTSKDTDLKIGMTARLDLIVEQKENVFAIPFDAFGKNEKGEDVLYRIEQVGEKQIATLTVVKKGMETDFFVEASSPDLKPGVPIVNDYSSVSEGMEVMMAAPDGMQPPGGGKGKGKPVGAPVAM